jgi:hypothetical protein
MLCIFVFENVDQVVDELVKTFVAQVLRGDIDLEVGITKSRFETSTGCNSFSL